MDIEDAGTAYLDVTEWAAGASSLLSSLDLGERMARCENYILDDIINPLASGHAYPLPPPVDASR